MKKAALILLILLLVAAAGTALYARQNPQAPEATPAMTATPEPSAVPAQTPVTLTDLDASPTPEAVG